MGERDNLIAEIDVLRAEMRRLHLWETRLEGFLRELRAIPYSEIGIADMNTQIQIAILRQWQDDVSDAIGRKQARLWVIEGEISLRESLADKAYWRML